MVKRLSLILTILLMLSIMVEAFHCHDDGAEHPECAICLASIQQADTGHTAPVNEIGIKSAEILYPRPVLAIVTTFYISPLKNRAPPRLISLPTIILSAL